MNILITGAGGPAAISFLKACHASEHTFWMGDMDAYSAGLFLVDEDKRVILPRGDSTELVPSLLKFCKKNEIDVLVPTVDIELLPLAQSISEFEKQGTKVIVSDKEALSKTIDKFTLLEHCNHGMEISAYALLDENFNPNEWNYPVLIKPRIGAGSRGIRKILSPEMFDEYDRDGTNLVQEYLPGEEYSVDCYVNRSGKCLAAVPRKRLKTDSGVAVVSATVDDKELIEQAKKALEITGNIFLANVQFKRNKEGKPRLLEINPRAAGTLPLTVEAGANTPMMALDDIEGKLSDEMITFKEIAVVRYLQEEFISIESLGNIPNANR
jgi:carbamoyl-phosphate synthase large subunit